MALAFTGKDLVGGKLLTVVRDQLPGGSVFFLRNQELQEARI